MTTNTKKATGTKVAKPQSRKYRPMYFEVDASVRRKKSTGLKPACGNPHHMHKWGQPTLNPDKRFSNARPIPDSTKQSGQRAARINDHYGLIRSCACGAKQVQNDQMQWFDLADPTYGEAPIAVAPEAEAVIEEVQVV